LSLRVKPGKPIFGMRFPIVFVSLLLLTSCNLPVQNQVTQTPIPSLAQTYTSTATLTPEAIATLFPPTPTSTTTPCDPLTADYCIIDGGFRFQNPIFPPGNMSVDISYRYGTTQNGKRDPHHGVELVNGFGTPVHAAGDGTVAYADSDIDVKFSKWSNYYGNLVVIRHADDFYTLYAHLSQILVTDGQQVKGGDLIGQVGQTGGAIGSHLHFEVRRGDGYMDENSTDNPERWLIPKAGAGTLSLTIISDFSNNYERPIVIDRYARGSDQIVFTMYATTYTGSFEHNPEDLAITDLPAGRYRISFNDESGLRQRVIEIEDGLLTEVFFQKQ